MPTLNQSEFDCGGIKAHPHELVAVQTVQAELVAVRTVLAAFRVKYTYGPIFDRVQEEAYRREVDARDEAFDKFKKEETALTRAICLLALAEAELHREQTIAIGRV